MSLAPEHETAVRLHDLLELSTREQPPPPPAVEVVTRCEQELRAHRRRWATRASAAVAAALVPVIVAVATAGPSGTSRPAGGPGMSDDELIDRCLAGNQGAGLSELFGESGRPRVAARSTIVESTTGALVSADDRYWADCFVHHYAGAEFASGMTLYETSGRKRGHHFSSGATCRDLDGPPEPPCPTFMVRYLDRLPGEVAAVEFTTADGATTTVPTTVDGFVLFTYVGDVPAGMSTSASGPRFTDWLTRVVYLDRDGMRLAGMNIGPHAVREQARRVGDLPLPEEGFTSWRSSPLEWRG